MHYLFDMLCFILYGVFGYLSKDRVMHNNNMNCVLFIRRWLNTRPAFSRKRSKTWYNQIYRSGKVQQVVGSLNPTHKERI